MAEYWKSTPKYWCKHCSVYVRDTKLERQNHDATAKHQGAVKRALRDLHRGHEKEEREKDRARREIERLNGVVSGAATATTSATAANATTSRILGAPSSASPRILPDSERKRQAEQLASLGVSLPEEFRRDLAMAGDWQVTSTTIVQEKPDDGTEPGPGSAARGIHKRERTDEDLEAEEAVKGLFKKPRRWGRDPRTAGGDGGPDLDALLSGGLTVKKKDEEDVKEEQVGNEDVEGEDNNGPPVKTEEEQQQRHELTDIKPELSDEVGAFQDDAAAAAISATAADTEIKLGSPKVKMEDGDDGIEPDGGACAPAVVFKKRKPKNIRQK
ncbi:hypothetical protein VPNG_09967 [Cytospora leucostoma]|uniref:U1-type domain-containing protein n=1 Tax=Cytospora leucostoma TaxID=1230097 RepID=A0A423VL35_9PEZI|nr:hypothetical protein VPNG_09967 [Cytospora leucostoma]